MPASALMFQPGPAGPSTLNPMGALDHFSKGGRGVTGRGWVACLCLGSKCANQPLTSRLRYSRRQGYESPLTLDFDGFLSFAGVLEYTHETAALLSGSYLPF